jgi:hypothetical protein
MAGIDLMHYNINWVGIGHKIEYWHNIRIIFIWMKQLGETFKAPKG